MNNPTLMKTATKAAKWSLGAGLPVKKLIKGTVYKHFCGGETVDEALEVAEKLDDYHVDTVLNYAAEAVEPEAGFNQVLSQILHNILLAKKAAGIGYISVKLTGLGHRKIFEKITTRETLSLDEEVAFERMEDRLYQICSKPKIPE